MVPDDEDPAVTSEQPSTSDMPIEVSVPTDEEMPNIQDNIVVPDDEEPAGPSKCH